MRTLTHLLSRLALVVACLSLVAPLQGAVVQGVRSYRAPDYTRLVFDLDGPLTYELSQQLEPATLVITLEGASFDGNFDNLSLAETPISSIGSSREPGGDLLVTLTLRAQVEPRSFTLGKNEQYGDRFVLDLYDVAGMTKAPDAETADPVATITSGLDDAGRRDIVVAISAGHGGDDPGAIGHGKLQEKNVTLALSRELARLIDAMPGYQSVLIRDGDYYVGLRQRTELGHKANADLYLAIHADAADNHEARGATVYALSERGATSEQARMLADKENNADLIGGIGTVSLGDKDAVLRSVLLDLSMTASVATSLEIGSALVQSLYKVTRLRRRNVEQAAFVELKSADIPSLLIEAGYITNAADAENLDSPQWRRRFAESLADGVATWFGKRPPRGTLIAWQQKHGTEGRRSMTSYVVQRGDALSVLAQRFDVSMDEIRRVNGLKHDAIQVGQTLKIPATLILREHKIERGETLSQIAFEYEVTLEAIRAVNELKSDTIRPGQILKIPTS